MKIFKTCLCVLLACISAMSMPMGGSTRTVIPADVQQIISVDYRALKNSDTAMQLKQQVLPPAMKAFEDALTGVGLSADRDVDQLTFAKLASVDIISQFKTIIFIEQRSVGGCRLAEVAIVPQQMRVSVRTDHL